MSPPAISAEPSRVWAFRLRPGCSGAYRRRVATNRCYRDVAKGVFIKQSLEMASEERKTIRLDDPRALRAYAHPLRLSLIGMLRRNGPMTATQCAAVLDENVPNCSFHLRQLAKYGLAE